MREWICVDAAGFAGSCDDALIHGLQNVLRNHGRGGRGAAAWRNLLRSAFSPSRSRSRCWRAIIALSRLNNGLICTRRDFACPSSYPTSRCRSSPFGSVMCFASCRLERSEVKSLAVRDRASRKLVASPWWFSGVGLGTATARRKVRHCERWPKIFSRGLRADISRLPNPWPYFRESPQDVDQTQLGFFRDRTFEIRPLP